MLELICIIVDLILKILIIFWLVMLAGGFAKAGKELREKGEEYGNIN